MSAHTCDSDTQEVEAGHQKVKFKSKAILSHIQVEADLRYLRLC